MQDNEGATPLHKAAFNGRAWCVKHLLEKGANVNAIDKDKGTPLHNAVYNGHTDCATILIRYKAKVTGVMIALCCLPINILRPG